MTTRRSFLRTTSLITLGLLTGPDAIEAMARLTHRRKFHALGAVPGGFHDSTWEPRISGGSWEIDITTEVGSMRYFVLDGAFVDGRTFTVQNGLTRVEKMRVVQSSVDIGGPSPTARFRLRGPLA